MTVPKIMVRNSGKMERINIEMSNGIVMTLLQQLGVGYSSAGICTFLLSFPFQRCLGDVERMVPI